DFIVELVLIFPVYYISIFFHELGHAVLGRLTGHVVNSFGLGLARPFAVFSCRGTRIYFCLSRPTQGLTFLFPEDIISPPWKSAVMYAGGLSANLLMGSLSLFLWFHASWGTSLWLVAALVNGFMSLISLIPFSVSIGKATAHTDG